MPKLLIRSPREAPIENLICLSNEDDEKRMSVSSTLHLDLENQKGDNFFITPIENPSDSTPKQHHPQNRQLRSQSTIKSFDFGAKNSDQRANPQSLKRSETLQKPMEKKRGHFLLPPKAMKESIVRVEKR